MQREDRPLRGASLPRAVLGQRDVRGQCSASETCEEGFFGVRCLPAAPLSVTGKAVPASATVPAAPKKEKEKEKPAVPEAATPR